MRSRGLALVLAVWLPAAVVHAADPGVEFEIAIGRGDLAAVKALLDAGRSADTPIAEGHQTPLQRAASSGKTEIAKLLIERGASVNAPAASGSALHLAIQGGWDDIVQLLIDNGADPDQRDAFDNTPLVLAVSAQHRDIAEILIKAGADLGASSSGLTPLMFASSTGDVDQVRFLVKAGAKVNGVGKGQYGGRSALLAAIPDGQADAVKALIELKADVNQKGPDGKTPLAAAREAKQEEIVTILKAAGARDGAALPAKKS
jgi:ankyrin repeat protein